MSAESAIIPSITTTSSSGNDISIITMYQEANTLPDTIEAFLADEDGIQDGVAYQQGDLIIRVKNHLVNINYQLNNLGELILLISTGDSSNYSINSNGELTYTTNT